MEDSEESHVYWFKDYWLHQIYCVGLESFTERIRGDVPYKENDAGGLRRTIGKGQSLLYWEATYKSDGYKNGPPKVDVFGKTLYARTEKKVDYRPIVHVRYHKASPPGVVCDGLYAARPFNVGDAIVLFSKLEESQGESILGGVHVRKIEHPVSKDCVCNAYLTLNRTLRCKRPMKTGEEITRCMR